MTNSSRQPSRPIQQIAIFLFDDVEVLDFAGPFEVFNVASEVVEPKPWTVYTVALTADPIKARGGLTILPHYSVANCPPPDMLLIPGGVGSRKVLKDEQALAWITEQAGRVAQLLSVCTGALVLAKAGLLNGLPATTHHTTFDLLQALSPTTTVQTDQRYVHSSELITTSGGISAGIDMSLDLVAKLLGEAAHAAVIKEMEWQWHQPRA